MERTKSLKEALTPEGTTQVSLFGSVISSIALFNYNFQHLNRPGPNEHPNDPTNGEFWKRHRKLDNLLSNVFMSLPSQLKLPYGSRNMHVIILHMNIHASFICLHQAAIQMASRHHVEPKLIRRSRDRSLVAAEEITNVMRLISHVDASNLGYYQIHFWSKPSS